MAWTTPITFTTGNTLTAAQMNTNVRDNSNYLFDPPMCLAQRTASQSITTGTQSAIVWNGTNLYDTDSMLSGTQFLVFNTAGVYDVWTSIEWVANATGMRRAEIQVAGPKKLAFDTDSSTTSAQNSAQNAKGQWKFAAGDNAEVWVYQTSGGNLSVLGTSIVGSDFDGEGPACYFGASWVGSGA